jgi:hypothetical protein
MPTTEDELSQIAKGVLKEVVLISEPSEHYYNKGLNDAWELAKKIVVDCSDMTGEEFSNIFGCYMPKVFVSYTPQEALAKMKAYEEQRNIEVGDVVESIGRKGIVTQNNQCSVHIICIDGSSWEWEITECKKTGKHIDIKSILEQIGE